MYNDDPYVCIDPFTELHVYIYIKDRNFDTNTQLVVSLSIVILRAVSVHVTRIVY